MRRPLQEQFSDPADSLGAALGIAIPDDLIEPRDQRCRNRHERPQNPPNCRMCGNLGALRERRVRLETVPRNGSKSRLAASRGLAGSPENRYISRNFWFSYDRVLRVGPAGPALFYYLNEPDEWRRPRSVSTAGPAFRPGLNPTQVRPTLTLDMIDPTTGSVDTDL